MDSAGRLSLFHIDKENYVPFIINAVGDAKLGIAIATKYELTGAENIFKTKFEKSTFNMITSDPRTAYRGDGGFDVTDLQWTYATDSCEIDECFDDDDFSSDSDSGEDMNVASWATKEYTELIKMKNKEQYKTDPRSVFGSPNKDVDLESIFNEPTQTIFQDHKRYKLKARRSSGWGDQKTNEDVHAEEDIEMDKGGEETNDDLLDTSRNRGAASLIASKFVNGNSIKPMDVVDLLLESGRTEVEKTTDFLLKYLQNRNDRNEDAALQTKLLEINLQATPQIAVAIMESDEYSFTRYDKNYIARLCESAGLSQQAALHYKELDDIKRVLLMGLHTDTLTVDFLLALFGDVTPEDISSIMGHLIQYHENEAQLKLVVEVAERCTEQLTYDTLIGLFEEFNCWSGLYLYLGNMVNSTTNSKVIFKYIVAASEVGQFEQIELICRENDHYNAKEVKAFLLVSNKIKDPRPLIHVCDRHGFIKELITYLYKNEMNEYIKIYIQRMNQSATPKVVGVLLDLDVAEDKITNLINAVRLRQCPIDELVEELEKKARLTVLLPWLERRFYEGLTDVALHNALTKIHLNGNKNNNEIRKRDNNGKEEKDEDESVDFESIEDNAKVDKPKAKKNQRKRRLEDTDINEENGDASKAQQSTARCKKRRRVARKKKNGD